MTYGCLTTKHHSGFCIWNTATTPYSVMTLAVADAFLSIAPNTDDAEIGRRLIQSMQTYGQAFPYAGYGGMFRRWLKGPNPQPYGSYGNGSAMRVSSAGWLFDDLKTVRHMARLSAKVTHNHPEGIKGAEATASAIYLARTGRTKAEIKAYIEANFNYDLSRSCDEIRPTYRHVESCQETVPEAITAFLEGRSFEDVIRTAVSLGGDCDTLTCIAGSIAEGYYGVPEELPQLTEERRKDLVKVVHKKAEEFRVVCLISAPHDAAHVHIHVHHLFLDGSLE